MIELKCYWPKHKDNIFTISVSRKLSFHSFNSHGRGKEQESLNIVSSIYLIDRVLMVNLSASFQLLNIT